MKEERILYIKKYIFYFIALILTLGILISLGIMFFKEFLITILVISLVKIVEVISINLYLVSEKLEDYFPKE